MHNVFRSILRVTVTGVLAAGLGLPVQTGHAQLQHQRKVEFRVQHFTTAEELPSNYVSSIQEDSLGFLWIGTGGGLVRYDGYTFTPFLPQPDDSTTISFANPEDLHLDASGHLWVGGNRWGPGGLSRYDPRTERFTNYHHNPDDPNSLIYDAVVAITGSPDDPDVLWVGAPDWSTGERGGLSRLDVATGTFTNYTTEDGLTSNLIWSLLRGRDGTLWVGTYDGGLNRFDPATNTFSSFWPHPDRAPDDVGANLIMSLYEDRAGVLWVGTWGGGLNRFDREAETFTSFFPQPGDRLHWSNRVWPILEDRTGMLWVGTNDGLYTFDRESERFTRFQHQPADARITSLHEDRFGVLWVGSEGGLMKLERWINPFTIYRHDPDDPNSLASNAVSDIYEDRAGILWIGNVTGWLNRVDRTTGTVTRYYPDLGQRDEPGMNKPITAIYEDRAGALWLGSCGGLINRMNRETGRFTRIEHDPDDPNSINRGCANHIFEDHAGTVWIALWGGGIERMDPGREDAMRRPTFTRYTTESHGLGEDNVYFLYEAPSEPGILWVGTDLGLSRFDTQTETFTNHHALSLRGTMMMHEDRTGRFWVATRGSGLHVFDRNTGTVERTYTTDDGLAHTVVRSIIEDDQGYLWLSTSNGISRFDPERQTFHNFYARDGLPGNGFNEGSRYQSASGALFFGTSNGAVSFFPKDLVDTSVPPEVVLTGLRLAGESVEIGSGSPLETSMMVAEALMLSHEQNNLTFEYVGLHPSDPAQRRYRYVMEGYDEAWLEAGTQRNARYTNLDPGDYVFRVHAASGSGVWNEEGTAVRITILPPWWRTTWAYVVYGLLFISTLYGADRIQRRRLLRKEHERAMQRELEQAHQLEKAHAQLQQTHEHLKATQNQLIHAEKMASLGEMTAGIAHEIKNPLNFVNNFAELAIELADDLVHELQNHPDQPVAEVLPEIDTLLEHLKRNAASINHHGKRADSIVQSMMQHASGATGERRATEVNALVEEYVNLAYHGMRAQRLDFNVEIERAYDAKMGEVEIVPQEIGRVLLNLLSNAFYAVHAQQQAINGAFTPTVRVSTWQMGQAVEIRVRDNGPGISADVKDKIFEPFFTTKPTGSGNTGLGLSLSYEIVVQGHGGTLQVESAEGEGATFVVTLPVREE